MNECSKSKAYWGPLERQATSGQGIDIGCGPDPVTPSARRFDQEDGDANVISEYVKDEFDFVYSSHCLEHMRDPKFTLLEWWKLVKSGGYLFVVVPDEDLYEQGVFPSRFNPDHKATFTISKSRSWSPSSYNVLDLGRSLPGGEVLSVELQDRGYDRTLMSFGNARRTVLARLVAKIFRAVSKIFGHRCLRGLPCSFAFGALDQTGPPYNAQAQIQLIVRKL